MDRLPYNRKRKRNHKHTDDPDRRRNTMINALTISTGPNAVTKGQELPAQLFDEFIRYIDRPGKTARTYITNLRQFVAWLRYEGISRPQRPDVIAYRDYLGQEHDAIQLDQESPQGWTYRTTAGGRRYRITCKPATVAQYLRSVCQFFRWTAASGYYPDIAANIHAPKIRQDFHKKDALTAADVLTIERAISLQAEEKAAQAAQEPKDTAGRISRATEQGRRLYAIYTLAVNAGLRTVEISRANVKDIETKDGQAFIYIWGKGHTEPDQKKPLAPEVYQAIREYLNTRADRPTANSPLFVSTGNRSGGQRIAETTISRMLKKAMQGAGYDSDRITAHTLRHTAGTNVMNLTGNIYTAQNYMRHSNPATTEIYLHNDTTAAEAETARALYNLYHGISGDTGSRAKLNSLLDRLPAAKIEQLAGIAAAMA